jgi:hypothetical protein
LQLKQIPSFLIQSISSCFIGYDVFSVLGVLVLFPVVDAVVEGVQFV